MFEMLYLEDKIEMNELLSEKGLYKKKPLIMTCLYKYSKMRKSSFAKMLVSLCIWQKNIKKRKDCYYDKFY